jgi:hypothetical protein
MKRIIVLTFLAAVSLWPCVVRTADRISAENGEVFELEGTIGKGLRVRMHLEKRDVFRMEKGERFVVGEQYSGHYLYEKQGKRIELKGYFNAQGMDGASDDPEVEISEFVEGKKTGVFIGKFDEKGNYTGQWESFEPQKELPFVLRIVSRRQGIR